ncbi:MAG: hypothetical protein QNL04_14120 [SAR324 cluster bacterium]|nr:hypothetical protein [SAR324 cluster bacterium]
METFLGTLIVFGLAISGMAIGVMITGRRIASCGNNPITCELCDNTKEKKAVCKKRKMVLPRF